MRICIVSGESRSTTGGLSAYARMLVRELRCKGISITTVARFDRPEAGPMDYAASSTSESMPIDGIPTRASVGPPSAGGRPFSAGLPHDRPAAPFAGLLRKSLPAHSINPSRAMPRNCDLVHYIGTGRELLGFAASRGRAVARRGFYDPAGSSRRNLGRQPTRYRSLQPVRRRLLPVRPRNPSSRIPRRSALAAGAHRACPRRLPRRRRHGIREAHGLADRPIVLFIGRQAGAGPKGFHALCEAMPKVVESVSERLPRRHRPRRREAVSTRSDGAYLRPRRCLRIRKGRRSRRLRYLLHAVDHGILRHRLRRSMELRKARRRRPRAGRS